VGVEEIEDHVVWEHLRREDFSGVAWESFATRLAEFGYQCMRAWTSDGTIFARCRRVHARGLSAAAMRVPLTREDQEELVQDTVARALFDLQRKARENRGWRADGGLTIRSYFVTACLFAFPTVYRTHRRRKQNEQKEMVAHHRYVRPEATPDIAEIWVDGEVETARLLEHVKDDDLRTAILLKMENWSYEEIAGLLGRSKRQVQDMVARYRAANGREGDADV
jgi:DNA-directed RNA polymerase specialized sigma24 family protein